MPSASARHPGNAGLKPGTCGDPPRRSTVKIFPVLPRASKPVDRPLHQRLTARVIAGADRLMRAGLRRMLMGQGVGPTSAGELDALLQELTRYNDPAILADPDRLLAPPPGRVRLATVARRSIADGHASHSSFASPYRPIHARAISAPLPGPVLVPAAASATGRTLGLRR